MTDASVTMKIRTSPSEKDSIRKEADNKYIVHANARNELGSLVLVAAYEG
jgi:hypothetical protein